MWEDKGIPLVLGTVIDSCVQSLARCCELYQPLALNLGKYMLLYLDWQFEKFERRRAVLFQISVLVTIGDSIHLTIHFTKRREQLHSNCLHQSVQTALR